MFSNGRARSGIIVLPCGAGKTLTGITAASHIKKSTLVLCSSNVSVAQWRAEFYRWANLHGSPVIAFTSKERGKMFEPSQAGVVISTYSMISYSGQRNEDKQLNMDQIKRIDWGLLILDEVQVVPAQMFRQVISLIRSHCKLGLTATLVREDEKIRELNFLIGPKLYEANWQDLQDQGYLAKVQCIEIWCEMTADFYEAYLKKTGPKIDRQKNSLEASGGKNLKQMYYVCNPNKFIACEFLVQLHEAKGDKIIVFSDQLFALEVLAKSLKRPFINGQTNQNERDNILSFFQKSDLLNTIFLSKIGDTSIDLPAANVIIQISSHFGSRRQEAQRLGRILRPKQEISQQAAANSADFNAFFYSLVSTDTQEMYYADKRQQFLIDQGYSFQVVQEMPYSRILKDPNLRGTLPFKYAQKEQQ